MSVSENRMPQDSVRKERPTRQISVVLRGPKAEAAAGDSRPAGAAERKPEPFAEMMQEFDRMIGLAEVKELLYEIYAMLAVKRYRTEAGLTIQPQVYHMVFKGNPGTGKTTVARMVARLFQEMGVLSKGHLIEAERADLVGEYIGHTALKTRELIKRAMGGVLFIDEAYSLARGGEKDFGKEAIDALVKAMEDNKNQFILILAGYPDEMEEFLGTNPGLPSRFPVIIDFPDYTIDQLLQIAGLLLKEREYVLTPQAEWKLRQQIQREKDTCLAAFSNGRFIRNLIEKALRNQAVRLLRQNLGTPSKQELMALRAEDLPQAAPAPQEKLMFSF